MIDGLFGFFTEFAESPFFVPYMVFTAIGGLSLLALYFLGGGKND